MKLVSRLTLLALLLFASPAAAQQRQGAGWFLGPNHCTDVLTPVASQSFCADYTTGGIFVYTGSAWIPISGNAGGTGGITIGTLNVTGSATINNLTATGTMTFPDGSTYTAAGHQNMLALGIGQATGSDPIDITANKNGLSLISLLNNSSGTAAQAAAAFNNGTTLALWGLTGTGYTSGGATRPANTLYLQNNSTTGGISIANSSPTPINFWVGATNVGTFSSTGLNITALSIATHPFGGSCANGQFFTGIQANGTPLCGAPGGSSGAPPQIVGFSSPQITEADTVSGDFTFTRAGVGSYVATVTKVNGTPVSPLATATVPLSIANGGTGTSTAPTNAQILIAQGSLGYAPMSVTGDAVLAASGILTVNKIGGVTPGGVCTNPQFVQTINSSGVPTCATPATSSGAPTTNPAGGANNYAPIASPTFTGTVTAPTLNVSSTFTIGGNPIGGTCTNPQFVQTISAAGVLTCATPAGGAGVPNGGPPQLVGYSAANTGEAETISGDLTLARAGANSYTATITKINGIVPGGVCSAGQFVSSLSSSAVPTCTTPAGGGGGAPLVNPAGGQNNYAPIDNPALTTQVTLTNNQNAATVFSMRNSDPGASAATSSQFFNGTYTDSFGMTGTGYSAGAILPPSSMFFYNAAPGGLEFWNNNSGPTTFWNGGSTKAGQFTATGLDVLGLTIGGVALGGTCTGGQVVSAISSAVIPTCITPSGGSGYPAGAPPQIGGFSATNTSEAETVTGDFILTRAGANSYTAAVTKTGGVAFTGLATATIPLSIANGGRGSGTAPTAGMIDVAQSATAFGAVAMSGDATISSAGVITVSKAGGVALGPIATAPSPLSIALGGRGTGTAPTAGQLSIAQSATAFGSVTMSGDATITSAGAITVSKIGGTAVSLPLSIANGGRGSGTAPVAGQLDIAASTTAAGWVTMSGDATITSLGAITVTKLNGITPGGTCTSPQFVQVISASGVPTCATPAAGSFAPLTNPAGGQNNYAPISNATFAGTTTSIQEVLSQTNTPALSIPAISSGEYMNFGTAGSGDAWWAQGARYAFGSWTADRAAGATIIHANGNSWQFYADTGLTVAGVYTPTEQMQVDTNGITMEGGSLDLRSPVAGAPFAMSAGGAQIFFPGGAISSAGPSNNNFAAGVHVNAGSNNWIADSTNATDIGLSNGVIGFYANTGLTVGASVAFTDIVDISTGGMNAHNTFWAQGPVGAASNGMINNNVQFNVTNGGTQELAGLCSGQFMVSDLTDGTTAVYLCGGAYCTMTGLSGGPTWVASTTAPAVGHESVAMDGASHYTLYNNTGGTRGYMALTICSRAGT